MNFLRYFFAVMFFIAIIFVIPQYVLQVFAFPTAEALGLSKTFAVIMNVPVNFLLGYVGGTYILREWRSSYK